MRRPLVAILAAAVNVAHAQPTPQTPPPFSAEVRQFVSVDAPVVALTHVRVIDGTGAPARANQTVVIERGVIRAVGDAARVAVPADARVLDLAGRSVLPGLVMLHEHMFYPSGGGTVYNEQAFSFPRLYLAGGVTTARTAGNMAGYADLELKKAIDAGRAVGPSLDVTAPYLNGPGLPIYQVHALTGPDDAREMVAHWADRGATSFKAYMQITRDELRAVIEEAHRRGLKVTGHLCSVSFREAAALGIDDLEHGLVVASDFVQGKQPDTCPAGGVLPSIAALDPASAPVQGLIRELVTRRVALTSTLTVFETFTPGRRGRRTRCSRRCCRRRASSTRAATRRSPRRRRRPTRRRSRTRCGSSATSSAPAGCWWRARTPPATAAWWPGSRTGASWSCWSRPG